MFQHGSPSRIDSKSPEAPHIKNGAFIHPVIVILLTDPTTRILAHRFIIATITEKTEPQSVTLIPPMSTQPLSFENSPINIGPGRGCVES